jgi:hypothetical protein
MKTPTEAKVAVPASNSIVPLATSLTKSPLKIAVPYVVIIGKWRTKPVNEPAALVVPMGLAPYGAAVVAIIIS